MRRRSRGPGRTSLQTPQSVPFSKTITSGLFRRARSEHHEVGLHEGLSSQLGKASQGRKAQPYECYSEFDFDIPIDKNGDRYDRYLVRMEEMRQSVRIIKQCLEPEGKGPIAVKDNKIVPP